MNDSENSTKRAQAIERLKLDRAAKRLKTVKILSVSGIAGLTLVVIGAWVLSGRKIVVSDEIKVFAASIIGFGIVFSPVTIWGVKKLWNPDKVYVTQVNAAMNKVVDVYSASPELWKDVDVVDGQPKSFSQAGSMVYLVTNFGHVDDIDEDSEFADHIPDDADGFVAAGTWLHEDGDEDIVTEQIAIDRNRMRNSMWAKVGRKLYAQFEPALQAAEMRHHKKMTDQSMEMNLFDSTSATDVLKEHIPEFEEIEEDKTIAQTIEEEVNEQISDANTANGEGDNR